MTDGWRLRVDPHDDPWWDMNAWTHVFKSAAFYRRSHAGALLGAGITTVVLTGALLVGDSVKTTLRRIALQRLGDVHYAMDAGKRFFADALADRVGGHLHAASAPVLRLAGIAMAPAVRSADTGGFSSVGVQVLGVDERFWRLGGGPLPPPLHEDEADVSSDLALALALHPGDAVELRVRKPGVMPEDAPLSSREDDLFRRRALRVRRIVADSELGRFSLRAEQAAPLNAFVSLRWLQDSVELPARANLLLVGPVDGAHRASVDRAIDAVWSIADAGVLVRSFEALGAIQVTSDRVFIDQAVADAAAQVAPLPVGALAYLVNSISNGAAGRSTPYSFVTAAAPSPNPALSPVPPDMTDDQLLINQWLADAIAATTGSRVAISYLKLRPSGGFAEEQRWFRVRRTLAMDAAAREKDLMPAFPGLSDVERCSDWNIGLPMDEERLRDKPNEAYWERFRQTPKAFVTLAAGQAMWGSRFGNLMALRYAYAPGREDALRADLTRHVPAAAIGLQLLPVRRLALLAVEQAQDLGQLFLGTSFFLIVSAMVLTALLFSFSIQQRSAELGTLMAVGWPRRRAARRLLAEGAVTALLGAALGTIAGAVYARWLVGLLQGPWSAATAYTPIALSLHARTLLLGLSSGFLAALISMSLSIRRLASHTVQALLSSDFSLALSAPRPAGAWSLVLAAFLAAAAAVVVAAARRADVVNPSGPFFAAGGLLLASGLSLLHAAFARCAFCGANADRPAGTRPISLRGMALRNAVRRRGRSLAVAGLFATSLFLVLAVSSMSLTAHTGKESRRSGTGGFALVAPCVIPVPEDLRDARARRRMNLDGAALAGLEFVPMKVRDGDDAGCLNLNRAQLPRLIGVDPEDFLKRKAFAGAGKTGDKWPLLSRALPDGTVPALAGDEDTLTWGLRKKAHPRHGDVLTYLDERGHPLQVRLVGALPHRVTVFHGSVLIALDDFAERFPSESGYRLFLIDLRGRPVNGVIRILHDRLSRFGLAPVSAEFLLNRFAAVEDTYLRIFLVLGALGLLLGTAGLGAVVLRNTAERRPELAALLALGFPRAAIRQLLWIEHASLLALGLGCGSFTAYVATLPSRHAVEAGTQGVMLLVAGVVAVCGLAWTWLAAWAATRGNLLAGLRTE